MSAARTFAGRANGDGYGRHALREPGGDNCQRDVAHIVRLTARGIHLTRYDTGYTPRHADSGDTQRTYGGYGRHAIPGNGRRVHGSPDDVRKVLRRARNHVAVLAFDTLDLSPAYVGKHRVAPTIGRHSEPIFGAFGVQS